MSGYEAGYWQECDITNSLHQGGAADLNTEP